MVYLKWDYKMKFNLDLKMMTVLSKYPCRYYLVVFFDMKILRTL